MSQANPKLFRDKLDTFFIRHSCARRYSLTVADRVFHLNTREENNSLCGRARVTTRKCDAMSDAALLEVSRSYHALTGSAASPIASHSRVVLRAPPVRVLLGPNVLSVFCKRDPLGLRGRPAGPARKPSQLCQLRMG